MINAGDDSNSMPLFSFNGKSFCVERGNITLLDIYKNDFAKMGDSIVDIKIVNSNITSKFVLNQLYKIDIESYEKADFIDSFSIYSKKLSSLTLSTGEKNSMSVIKYLITNIMIENPVICAYDSLSSVSQKFSFCEEKLKKFKQERNLDLFESFPIFVNENTISDSGELFSYYTDEILQKYKNYETKFNFKFSKSKFTLKFSF